MESVNVRVVKLKKIPGNVWFPEGSLLAPPEDELAALDWNGTECVLELKLHADEAEDYVTFGVLDSGSEPRRMQQFAGIAQYNIRMQPPQHMVLEVFDERNKVFWFLCQNHTEYENFIRFVRDRVRDKSNRGWKEQYDSFSVPRSPRRAPPERFRACTPPDVRYEPRRVW